MIIKSQRMNRRTVLRGLGAAMSLPLLDAMLPNARAADLASRPKRLQALYSPNGMIMERFTPEKTGRDFALTPTLEPFAPFKDRMTVITGLAHLSGRGTHAQGCAGFLSAAEPRPTEGADLLSGVSIDQIIARKYENDTLLPSLEMGIETAASLGSCNPGYSCAYTNTLSWRDETSPLPVTINPREVFERMFGDGDATDHAARVAQQQRKASILDFVREDAARLSGKLGSNDRLKMDQYATAVRDVERRIQMANERNVGEFAAGADVPAGVPTDFAEHVKLMLDLQVIAMQADITRVGTFMIGRELSNRTTLVPALFSRSIGLGGDSAVAYDGRELRIGPRREGPPAALGGPRLTPTDAVVALGAANIGEKERAWRALEEVGAPFGVEPLALAERIVSTFAQKAAAAIDDIYAALNRRPVYTVSQVLAAEHLEPDLIIGMGGPAGFFIPRIAQQLKLPYRILPHHEAANAIGAAASRPTVSITLRADTALGQLVIPELDYAAPISRPLFFDLAAARREAIAGTISYAQRMGTEVTPEEIEITEEEVFNMVRGFRTIGKQYTLTAQVKPKVLQVFCRQNIEGGN